MTLLPLLKITVPLVKDWYISFDYFCSEVVFKINSFSGHLDAVSVIVYVTIWLTHGSINLHVSYTLTYTFVCGLWLHDFDVLYCSRPQNLPRCIETIVSMWFDQQKKRFEDYAVHSVITYLMEVPVSCCDFSHLE